MEKHFSLRDRLLSRFLRYVQIHAPSNEENKDQYPSTLAQIQFGQQLVGELQKIGLLDAEIDDYGIVMASLPSTLGHKKVPVIGLIAHLDTSCDVPNENVKPILHRNYSGGDLFLPGTPNSPIRVSENPELLQYIGHEIITSDGTTLLGADDRAGIAEIMTFLEFLLLHPEIPHGPIRIAFTPDEEIGRGVEHFDIQKFGADIAYTVDGGGMGEIEDETFHARVAIFTIHGKNVHPGYAKGKMVNALQMASEILQCLKNEPGPETTEGRQGYLHPHSLSGSVEKAILKILIRDFDFSGIAAKIQRLQEIQKHVEKQHPKGKVDLEIGVTYSNMRDFLQQDPRIVEYALEAVRRTGISPQRKAVRGGTDGAKLCEKGLLTANIFTGGHNFHSTHEWISLQAMEKAVETLIQLAQIWVEREGQISPEEKQR